MAEKKAARNAPRLSGRLCGSGRPQSLIGAHSKSYHCLRQGARSCADSVEASDVDGNHALGPDQLHLISCGVCQVNILRGQKAMADLLKRWGPEMFSRSWPS